MAYAAKKRAAKAVRAEAQRSAAKLDEAARDAPMQYGPFHKFNKWPQSLRYINFFASLLFFQKDSSK
jgi:predicted LPLAT superfamily acyltransferase